MTEKNERKTNELSPSMEIKRLGQHPESAVIFGATLEDVEKHEHFYYVPKFIVECIRIIELEGNLQTNGIYRASGRKDSIDKLRKRVKFIIMSNYMMWK